MERVVTEAELRHRFAVRTERFAHGAFEVEMVLPRAADELIDESAFDADERLPYWAELWPSARALTRMLLDAPDPPMGRVVELGCGLGLPSLALRWRGVDVLATDYSPEALDFARVNALRNGIPVPRTLLLDWRNPPPGFGPYDLVIAADVLYERRNAEALAELLPRITAPTGRAWVADPGRLHRPPFETALQRRGWRTHVAATLEEPVQHADREGSSRVRVLELRPPG